MKKTSRISIFYFLLTYVNPVIVGRHRLTRFIVVAQLCHCLPVVWHAFQLKSSFNELFSLKKAVLVHHERKDTCHGDHVR